MYALEHFIVSKYVCFPELTIDLHVYHLVGTRQIHKHYTHLEVCFLLCITICVCQDETHLTMGTILHKAESMTGTFEGRSVCRYQIYSSNACIYCKVWVAWLLSYTSGDIICPSDK